MRVICTFFCPQQKREGENDITYFYTEMCYLVPEISVQLRWVHSAVWKFQHRLHYVVFMSYESEMVKKKKKKESEMVAKMQIFIENH